MHVVKRGETLDGIAKKYNVSTAEILKANRLQTASRVVPGRKLVIPNEDFDSDAVNKPEERPAKTESKSRDPKSINRVYMVKQGDTLADIAKAHKVSLKDLLKWNQLKDGARIYAGDTLKLSPLADLSEKAQEEEIEATHTVQSGECPAKIAKLYGVKLDDLLEWNKLPRTAKINIGDKLVIRGCEKDQEPPKAQETGGKARSEKSAPTPEAKEKSASEPAPKGGKKVIHTVAKGETPSTIAARYGVKTSEFLAWNNLTGKSIIRAGAQHVVYLKDDAVRTQSKDEAKDAKAETKVAKAEPKTTKSDAKPDGKIAKAGPKSEKTDAKTAKVPAKDAPADTKTAKATPKADKPQAKSADGNKTTHVVAKGETPSSIAHKYKVKLSDLYSWNGWGKNVVLQIGQKVTIQKK
jgi:membrane-bound lytic murein transglycosylase D